MNIIKNYTSDYKDEYYVTLCGSPQEMLQQLQAKTKNDRLYAVFKLVANYQDNQEFLKNSLTYKKFNKIAFSDQHIERFHNVKAIKNLLTEAGELVSKHDPENTKKVLEEIEQLQIDAQLIEKSTKNSYQRPDLKELDYNIFKQTAHDVYFKTLLAHLMNIQTSEMSISQSAYETINSDLMKVKTRKIQLAEGCILEEQEKKLFFAKIIACIFDKEYSCSKILDILKEDYTKFSNKPSDELFKDTSFVHLYFLPILLRTPLMKEEENLLQIIETDLKKMSLDGPNDYALKTVWHITTAIVHMNRLMFAKNQEEAEILVTLMHEHQNSIAESYAVDKNTLLSVLGDIAAMRCYIASSFQQITLSFKNFHIDLSKLICAPLQKVTIEDNEKDYALQKARYNNNICKALLHNLHVEGYSSNSALMKVSDN